MASAVAYRQLSAQIRARQEANMGSHYTSTLDLAEAEARRLLDDFFDMAHKSGLNRIDIIEILEHEVEALRLREKLPEIKLNSVQFGTCSFLAWPRALRLYMGVSPTRDFFKTGVTCRCEPLGSDSGRLAQFGAACPSPALARAVSRAARDCTRWVRDGDRHP